MADAKSPSGQRRGDAKSRRKPAATESIRPRIKVWLESGGEYVFGYGLCNILQAVADTHSIKEAAAKLDKSYRYVWARIKEAEDAIGQRLVETRVGGARARRSSLTPLAQRWILDFTALRNRMFEVVEAEFSNRFHLD